MLRVGRFYHPASLIAVTVADHVPLHITRYDDFLLHLMGSWTHTTFGLWARNPFTRMVLNALLIGAVFLYERIDDTFV